MAHTNVPNLVPHIGPGDVTLGGVPHPRPFLLHLQVDEDEIGDIIDHVSNVAIVRWLDRAAELHADSLGETRAHLRESGLMWFVARHEIDYLAEAWLGDELVMATWVRNMRRIKSWRDYLVVRPADRTVICRAATLWVLVDLGSRRPTRIPPEMVQRYEPLQVEDGPVTRSRSQG